MCIHFPNFISQSYRMISEDIAHKSYGKLIIYLYAAFCKFLQFIKEKYIFGGVDYFFNSKFFICNKTKNMTRSEAAVLGLTDSSFDLHFSPSWCHT